MWDTLAEGAMSRPSSVFLLRANFISFHSFPRRWWWTESWWHVVSHAGLRRESTLAQRCWWNHWQSMLLSATRPLTTTTAGLLSHRRQFEKTGGIGMPPPPPLLNRGCTHCMGFQTFPELSVWRKVYLKCSAKAERFNLYGFEDCFSCSIMAESIY